MNNQLSQLFEYTALEQKLRDFYVRYGHPMNENQVEQLMAGINENASPIQPPEAVILIPAPQGDRHIYSEAYIQKDADISFVRHLRYFPDKIHSHEFIEIAYVYEGQCRQRFIYPNDVTEDRILKNGAVCILPPRITHTVFVDSDSTVINILVRSSTLKNSITRFTSGDNIISAFFINVLYGITQPHYILMETGADKEIHGLIEQMLMEFVQKKLYFQRALSLQLGLFFTYLQRDYSGSMQFSSHLPYSITYISRIYEYIEKHYRTASVAEIAESFSVSPSYLSRLVKKYTGTTISSLVQRVRMQTACDLLTGTDMSVQQICEAVGYGEVSFFIRLFKQHTGKTPHQYRKEYFLMP